MVPLPVYFGGPKLDTQDSQKVESSSRDTLGKSWVRVVRSLYIPLSVSHIFPAAPYVFLSVGLNVADSWTDGLQPKSPYVYKFGKKPRLSVSRNAVPILVYFFLRGTVGVVYKYV